MTTISIDKSFKNLEVLRTSRFIDQNPAGLGFANAINGRFINDEVTDVTSSDNGIKVHNNGDIELLTQDFQYDIEFVGRLGRTGGAGVANLIIWFEVATDGFTFAQDPNGLTTSVEFDNADVSSREVGRTHTDRALPVGTKFRLRVARGDAGNDDGGLITQDLSATSFSGLNNVASGSIIISKVIGI